MRRIAFSAAVLLISGLAFAAGPPNSHLRDHNRFKWRDSEGNLHYSDVLPPEAARSGYEIVNPQGLVVRRVDREKTEQERDAAKAELAKAEAVKKADEARQRSDQQLVESYPTEADLKRAQSQQSDMMEQNIASAKISLQSQEASLADLLGHAAELDRSGKPVPAPLARRIAEARKQVETQRAYVARKEREHSEALTRFDGELAHYRELKDKTADRR